MKLDELSLLIVLEHWHGKKDRPFVTTFGQDLGIHHKRVEYLLLKWSRSGWWDCGVSARIGWLTKKGLEMVLALKNNSIQ